MKLVYYTLLAAVVFYTQAPFADVYKGQDKNGNTIYSDKPFENSNKIDVNLAPTYTSPPVTTPLAPIKIEAAVSYQVSIVAPTQDQTFTNEITAIEVKVSVTPTLQKGDTIQLLLNGQPHGTPSDSTTFTLQSLFRGAYTIKAQVINETTSQSPIAQSQEVTFYQKRPMIH